jgi:hypothetical protein
MFDQYRTKYVIYGSKIMWTKKFIKLEIPYILSVGAGVY